MNVWLQSKSAKRGLIRKERPDSPLSTVAKVGRNPAALYSVSHSMNARSLRLAPAVLLFFCAAPALSAAQVPADQSTPASTLKVDAKLVVVPVVVRDKHGALIKDLGKTDFALIADEKPQAIRYFDRDNDVPLTLGLLVDTSQSQREVLEDEREGSRAFLDTLLTSGVATKGGGSDAVSGPGSDKAFVMQFAHEIELLQDVTDQRPALSKALKGAPGAGHLGAGVSQHRPRRHARRRRPPRAAWRNGAVRRPVPRER